MLQEEPYVYKASKIKNTSPKGIITVTVEQDEYNPHKDYVNLETGEMYADYYSSTIQPEEVVEIIEENKPTNIISIEAKTYKVRINGGSKVLNAKFLDVIGNDITNNYHGEILKWKFYIDEQELDNSLIKLDNTYNNSVDHVCKCKFYFLGNEDFLNKKLTVKLSTNDLSASTDLDIVS